MDGWIKMHRSVQGHWIFSDAEKYRAWVIILFTVNFEPKKVIIKNEIFECQRGQSLLSLKSWAEKFGENWNKSKVRRFFTLLKKDSMIVLKSEHVTTRLTVCNYDAYQDEQNADETQVKRKRNANETQTTPTKERKERKERKEKKIDKEKKPFEKFYADCFHETSNIKYQEFISFLMKKNNTDEELKMVHWPIKGQITEERFLKIMELADQKAQLIARVCENMHNSGNKKYISFYLTLRNWIKNEKKFNEQ